MLRGQSFTKVGILGLLGILGNGSFALATAGLVTVAPRVVALVSAFMLLHVVFARKGLVADGAVHTFLPGVFLPMPGSMSGRGKGSLAIVRLRIWTRILVLLAAGRRWANRRRLALNLCGHGRGRYGWDRSGRD